MQNFLKNQDLFGHPVHLNFNGGGPQHNTVVGGFVTLFVKALMLAYVSFLIKRMVMYEDDELTTTITSLEFEENEETTLKVSNTSRVQVYKF